MMAVRLVGRSEPVDTSIKSSSIHHCAEDRSRPTSTISRQGYVGTATKATRERSAPSTLRTWQHTDLGRTSIRGVGGSRRKLPPKHKEGSPADEMENRHSHIAGYDILHNTLQIRDCLVVASNIFCSSYDGFGQSERRLV